MIYNPYIHHRRSIRLKGYDYSSAGCYFITICTHYRLKLFGDVVDGVMILNKYGKIVNYTWIDLPNHNHHIQLGNFMIMPNHVHGIIMITDVVGAGSKPAPTKPNQKHHGLSEIIRQFKTFSARRINNIRKSPGTCLWQRNYYERIIRNEKEYYCIINYMDKNPLYWDSDNDNYGNY